MQQSQGALINQKSDTQKHVLIITTTVITYIIVTAKPRDLSTFTFCHNGGTSLSLSLSLSLSSLSLSGHCPAAQWALQCRAKYSRTVQFNLLKCTVSEIFAVQTFLHCNILHLLKVWTCPCNTLHCVLPYEGVRVFCTCNSVLAVHCIAFNSSALCVAIWGCESVRPVRLLGSLCHYQTSTQHPTSHLDLYHLFGCIILLAPIWKSAFE